MLHVFVPTRGRAHRRKTIENFHLETLHGHDHILVTVLVPECERTLWDDCSLPIATVPDAWRIEHVRQHIVDEFTAHELHLVLDDDLTLYEKKGKTETRKIETLTDVSTFIAHVRTLLVQYHHGGVSTTSNHHFCEPGIRECERALCVHFYRRSSLQGVRLTDCPEYEDMHYSLSLIERGLPNVVSYHYVVSNATNSTGGCSRYRSLDTQNANAAVFREAHPMYVKTTKPRYSKVWKGEKIGVRVQWKRALTQRNTLKTKGT